jgi:hypothetical protein
MIRALPVGLVLGLAACAGTAPVPIAPGTFFVSVPITPERDEAAARALATGNAEEHCDRRRRAADILDEQFTPAHDGMPDAIDLVFRCGDTAD